MFEFNKNGKRKHVEGKVIKIVASDTTDSRGWYIIVDGSIDFSGQMERFCPNQILDVEVIQKHDLALYISTPNDSTHITDMRVVDGLLQVSIDGGYSWITPKNYSPEEDGEIEDDNIASKPPRRKKKPVVIEGEDDEDSDDEDESESIDPEYVIEDEVY
jgi:hypothetical protein